MWLQVVIDSTTKKVKRLGYVDFDLCEDFDDETEDIVEIEGDDFTFENLAFKDYYYDEANETFYEG